MKERLYRVKCAFCKATIERSRTRLSGHDRHYCSRVCQQAGRKARGIDNLFFRKAGTAAPNAPGGFAVQRSIENLLGRKKI